MNIATQLKQTIQNNIGKLALLFGACLLLGYALTAMPKFYLEVYNPETETYYTFGTPMPVDPIDIITVEPYPPEPAIGTEYPLYNYGNIRKSEQNKWLGQVDCVGDFVCFDTPRHAVRAMERLLLTYQDKYGIDTIHGIMMRWAPPIENHTESVIFSMEVLTGIDRHMPLDFRDSQTMSVLIQALIRIETGEHYEYRIGEVLSGLVRYVQPPRMENLSGESTGIIEASQGRGLGIRWGGSGYQQRNSWEPIMGSELSRDAREDLRGLSGVRS